MEQRLTRMEQDIQDNRYDISDIKTRLAVAENNIQDIKVDLGSIKSNTTWIIRLIIGAIVLAVIGFIMQGGLK